MWSSRVKDSIWRVATRVGSWRWIETKIIETEQKDKDSDSISITLILVMLVLLIIANTTECWLWCQALCKEINIYCLSLHNVYKINIIHILQIVIVKVAQSCLILWDPMDYAVHGIFQARILEWVVFPFSRGPSQSR